MNVSTSFFFVRQNSAGSVLGSAGFKCLSADRKKRCTLVLTAAHAMVTEGWPNKRTISRAIKAQRSRATFSVKIICSQKKSFCQMKLWTDRRSQNKPLLGSLDYQGERLHLIKYMLVCLKTCRAVWRNTLGAALFLWVATYARFLLETIEIGCWCS